MFTFETRDVPHNTCHSYCISFGQSKCHCWFTKKKSNSKKDILMELCANNYETRMHFLMK